MRGGVLTTKNDVDGHILIDLEAVRGNSFQEELGRLAFLSSQAGNYALSERVKDWKRDLRPDSTFIFDVPRRELEGSVRPRTGYTHYSGYSTLIECFDALAPEIYPSLSPEAATQYFRQEVVRSHRDGDLERVLDPVRKAFGQSGANFLFSWHPYSDTMDDLNILLAAFVKCAAIPEPHRQALREEICDFYTLHEQRLISESVEQQSTGIKAFYQNWVGPAGTFIYQKIGNFIYQTVGRLPF